jgi:hypothetical protein
MSNHPIVTIHPADADPAKVAAALAAIAILLEGEQAESASAPEPWQWRAASALLAQRVPAYRVSIRPHWGAIERIRRHGN